MGKKLKTIGCAILVGGAIFAESQWHLTDYVSNAFTASKNAVVDVFTVDDQERMESIIGKYKDMGLDYQTKTLSGLVKQAPYEAAKEAVFEGAGQLTPEDNYQLAKKSVGRIGEEKKKQFLNEVERTGSFFENLWDKIEQGYQNLKK